MAASWTKKRPSDADVQTSTAAPLSPDSALTRPTAEGLKQTAHAIAKINHLNEKKTYGFLQALLGERPDLLDSPQYGDLTAI
jgi:hypothetical protein